MTFDEARRRRAQAIADAVLLEGYVLYPYRATSAKNRFRHAFGVLTPKTYSASVPGADPSFLEMQCLVREGPSAVLDGRLRFLQVCRRTVERAEAGCASATRATRDEAWGVTFTPVDALEVDGEPVVTWDEGEAREHALPSLSLDTLAAGEVVVPFALPASESTHELRDASGTLVGRVRRTMTALRGSIRLALVSVIPSEAIAGAPLHRLTVRVSNETPFDDLDAPRERALAASFASTHLLFAMAGGGFVSLLDPPPVARDAAAACRNVGTFPVLAGDEGEDDLLLSAPIILYDHPRIAPESPGDFFDATEIDELLQLRTSLLTADERRMARATDPRSAAILDRVDGLSPEAMEKLHGAIRELEAEAPSEPLVQAPYPPGSRVRIRPSRRRTDAQDLLYVGRVATVEKILEDVDGSLRLAVTFDDDPAAEFHRWYGRFHHYRLEEVEPVEASSEVSR